jgi:hypothetical protein
VPDKVTPAAPPWHLTGDAYIWLFWFPREFVERNGFLADWQRDALGATLGAVMLIDYRESDVGPYRELLFLPGRMNLAGHGVFSISKIYVSTPDSVANGIENWGIPKQLAAFERTLLADGGERFCAALDGREFFAARLEPFGPRFPFSSVLIPVAVGQERRGDLLITRPSVKGTGRLCRARDVRVTASCFPDIARLEPIAVAAVRDFRMTFPVPQIVPGFFGQVRSA